MKPRTSQINLVPASFAKVTLMPRTRSYPLDTYKFFKEL
jgi:hypothetical protein